MHRRSRRDDAAGRRPYSTEILAVASVASRRRAHALAPLPQHASTSGSLTASALERLAGLHVWSTEIRLRELGTEGPRDPLLEALGPGERLVGLEMLIDTVELGAVSLGEHVVFLLCLPCFANDAVEVERSGTFRRHDRVVWQDGRSDPKREAVAARDLGVKLR